MPISLQNQTRVELNKSVVNTMLVRLHGPEKFITTGQVNTMMDGH